VLVLKVTYRVCVPLGTGAAVVVLVTQSCQPPVPLTVIVANGVAVSHDILTVFLNGSGGIQSVINGTGAAVSPSFGDPSDVVTYP
jgi:hypothetical protein